MDFYFNFFIFFHIIFLITSTLLSWLSQKRGSTLITINILPRLCLDFHESCLTSNCSCPWVEKTPFYINLTRNIIKYWWLSQIPIIIILFNLSYRSIFYYLSLDMQLKSNFIKLFFKFKLTPWCTETCLLFQ